MDEKELKVKLVIDEKALSEFKNALNNTIGGIQGGNTSLSKVNKSNNSIELEKIKIAKEQLKLDIMRKKETERLLKIEEKRTKQLDKQTKEITLFSKILNKMGFRGSAGGEVVRGGFRELGVGMVNTVGDSISNLSGGWVNGTGFLSGGATGATLGGALGGVVGAGVGAIIGALSSGVLLPTINKLTENFTDNMAQQREALLKLIPQGDIQSQLQATQDIKQYQAKKNQLMLASNYKLSDADSGKFVSVLNAIGVDAVGFYKQALKLSKTKTGEFYGKNPTEIMDLIITSLTSKQYTKQQRVENYNKIQATEGIEDLFSGVDITALEKGIRTGNLEEIIKYYDKLKINELQLGKSIDKATSDDITTNLDILKDKTDFINKNIDKVIDYENSIVALTLKYLNSTKALEQQTGFYNETVKLANGELTIFKETIKQSNTAMVEESNKGAGSLFNPFR
jgi:hypothetical protein